MRIRTWRPVGVGLSVWLVLVVAACAIPLLTGWNVRTALDPNIPVPPLHAEWLPRVGWFTIVAVGLGVAGVIWGPSLAQRLGWRPLLLATYAGGLAWMLSLAFVDGAHGLRALGFDSEYLPTARETDDITAMMGEYIERIPEDQPDNWPIHIAGHPPGAVLVYIGLVRIGLGGTVPAALVTCAAVATAAVAVLVTLRRLGAEDAARRVAPFLVLGPTALWYAISGDAMFTTFAAWGLATLAIAATSERGRAMVGWSVVSGLLLGSCVMLSYGLPLLGTLALAILAIARSWRPLPIVTGAALVVVLGFAAWGFAWWEAFPVLRGRYYTGLGADRPASYWIWGNLAALGLAVGPALAAGTAVIVARWREIARPVLLLAAGAWSAILIADLSLMSKGETERIWLPWMPWLLVVTAAVPEVWRKRVLVLQVVTALLLQHLVNTTW